MNEKMNVKMNGKMLIMVNDDKLCCLNKIININNNNNIIMNNIIYKYINNIIIDNKYFHASIEIFMLDFFLIHDKFTSLSNDNVIADDKIKDNHNSIVENSDVSAANSLDSSSSKNVQVISHKVTNPKDSINQIIDQSQAILFVLDSSIPNSTDNLIRQWKKAFGDDSFKRAETKLCVMIGYEKIDQNFQDWCLDNYFEIVSLTIPTSLNMIDLMFDPSYSKQKLPISQDHDDPQGIPRIIEALNVVMWDGMEKKHQQQTKLSNSED